MANRFPLIANSSANQIQELANADNLDLTGNSIVGIVSITATGNISIGGTLTYEDVTNVDSIGVVTARAGIKFGLAGVGGTITADGHAEFAGVCTSSSFIKEGGTSSQFLKGDGSVDSTSYANTGKAIAMSIVFG